MLRRHTKPHFTTYTTLFLTLYDNKALTRRHSQTESERHRHSNEALQIGHGHRVQHVNLLLARRLLLEHPAQGSCHRWHAQARHTHV